jgi:hypothetical protein
MMGSIMYYTITNKNKQTKHTTMKNILIILAAATTLVSCDSKKFEVPVGYMTVPVYASDIEKYKADQAK